MNQAKRCARAADTLFHLDVCSQHMVGLIPAEYLVRHQDCHALLGSVNIGLIIA